MNEVEFIVQECEAARFARSATCLLYNEMKNVLFSGSENGEIGLWKAVMGEDKQDLIEIKSMKLHKGKVISLWYHPDTDALVTAGADNTVVLWNEALDVFLEMAGK